MSQFTIHMSHIPYHMSPSLVTNSNSHKPSLLTPPLSTVDWFQLKKVLINHEQKNIF